jgi:hypothetical protein
MVVLGFSIARTNRAVITLSLWEKALCTETTT